jgi:OOP family OmpA-OmpF porin
MITRSSRAVLAGTLLACAALAARAEGPYVGGNLGTPDYHSSINGVSGDGSGTGFKLYGGYQFNPNFALEGGYFDLGHIDDATGKVNTRGAFVDAVGLYEFAPKWSVLGSAGLAQARFTSDRGDDWSPGIKLGAGLQYDLSRELALRAQYDRYHFSDAFDSRANVGQVSVGLKYGF